MAAKVTHQEQDHQRWSDHIQQQNQLRSRPWQAWWKERRLCSLGMIDFMNKLGNRLKRQRKEVTIVVIGQDIEALGNYRQ